MIDCLKSLSFVSRYYSGDVSDIYPGTPRFDRMALTANVNQKSLRRLCILGEVFAACNTWSFSSLIDLALLSPIDSVGLHSVFEDLIQLQSLTICLDHFVDGETIADVFEEHSDALSHLKHFKLLAMGLDPEDINAVAAFLRLKASLERLDFVSQSRAGPELKNEPLLAVLNDLPHLTVFGCDVRTRRLTADHLARLSACIPQQVTALVLNVAVEFEWATTEEDWAQFVSPASRHPAGGIVFAHSGQARLTVYSSSRRGARAATSTSSPTASTWSSTYRRSLLSTRRKPSSFLASTRPCAGCRAAATVPRMEVRFGRP